MDNEVEKTFYSNFLSRYNAIVSDPVAVDAANNDPSNDDYIFTKDGRYPSSAGIVQRYGSFANPQGNSSNNLNGGNVNGNSKTQPDNEDLNNDNTLNETEEYFQYRVAFDEKQFSHITLHCFKSTNYSKW